MGVLVPGKLFKALLSTALFSAGSFCFAKTASANLNNVPSFIPGEDSYRLTFEFGSARRYATRYLEDKRVLQIRVTPAKVSEFDSSRFYDTKYVQRVVLEQDKEDVIVNLQLKNVPIAWIIAEQKEPWRLVVDMFKTESPFSPDANAGWAWQNDAASQNVNVAAPITEQPSVVIPPISQTLLPVTQADVTQSSTPVTPIKASAFKRIDIIAKVDSGAIAELQNNTLRNVGTGTDNEFDNAALLASSYYLAGQVNESLSIFRRIASSFESKFKESPKVMWHAGESALLSGLNELAADYYYAIKQVHPNSEYAWLARFRLAQISSTSSDAQKEFSEIALSDKSPWSARAAAAVEISGAHVDESPNIARPYQQNFSKCVAEPLVHTELRIECAYIQTRYDLDKLDLLSADAQVQKFKQFAPNDKRAEKLEKLIEDNVRIFLSEISKSKAWGNLLDFEKKARPQLLEFSLKDPSLVFARAEAWLAAGEVATSAKLYSVYWQTAQDEKQKLVAAANAALTYKKIDDSAKAELYLKRLDESQERKNSGLGDRATSIVRTLTLSPYKNKKAYRLFLEEITTGRFVERDLNALLQLADIAGSSEVADNFYDKISSFPARNADEWKSIEDSLIQYAEQLQKSKRATRSADFFSAAANLAQGAKKAEAAYKAGVMYARAGLIEKAKSSWQLAAGDVNDKKYSSLASERLDRIR